MSKISIYHASAGSGKTYRLTEEYLKLLFQNPYNYRHILAVTFTNKATGEMKDRIIGELYNIASGKKSGHAASLQSTAVLSPEKLKEAGGKILGLILNDYSRFSVMTIDTFFQRIIRSFAREMGFPALFNIELDNEKVLDRAIEKLLLEIEDDTILRNWLVLFAEDRIKEGKNWNLIHDMRRLGFEIFRENYKESLGKQNLDSSYKTSVEKYLSQLKAIRYSFENTLIGLGKEALELIRQNSLETTDFYYGNLGFANYFRKMASGKFDPPGDRVFSAVDNQESWCSKNSSKKKQIFHIYENGLNDLLKMIINYFKKNSVQYNTAITLLKNIYSLAILRDISRKVSDYNRDNNSFLLSDAPFFLHSVIAGNDAPFIYEKTGYNLRNFMIDEFQDTSALQWNNFKPLILNSLSEDNISLIVGDVKQSIYRWRNGDWKLLAGESSSDFSGFGTNLVILDTNRRSKKNIVGFNNCIFYYASLIMQDHLNSAISSCEYDISQIDQLKEIIHSVYHDSYQKLPADNAGEKTKGDVHIGFLSQTEGESFETQVLERIPVIIEELQDRGFALRDIAVIVRKKEEGRKIADAVIQYKNSKKAKYGYRYDMISNESLFIGSSVVVRFILQVMKYMVRPDDLVNCTALMSNFHININSSGISNEKIFSAVPAETVKELLEEKFRDYQYIASLPVYELTENIVFAFGLNLIAGEIAYLQEFQNVIIEYCENEPISPAEFIEWWEEEGREKSIYVSEFQDAVRILTIHKAKGLEFKVVLIPFCRWLLDHDNKHASILWCETGISPFDKIGLLPVRYSSDLKDTIFYNEYYTEKMQAYVDNLNLMYVAFTRAISSLYIFAPLPVKPGILKTTGDLLHRIINNYDSYPVEVGDELKSLIDIKSFWNDESKEFILGEPSGNTKYIETGDSRFILNEYPSSGFERKLKIKADSKVFFTQYTDQVQKQISYGRMMHGIFSEIKTLIDVPRVLERIYTEGKLSDEECQILKKKIDDIFKDDKVSDWFSGRWYVRNESPVLAGTGRSKVPDRILTDKDKAVVIEYKFGETKQPFHNDQVRDYISIVSSMGYTDVTGYLWYFSTDEIIEIR